MTGGTGSWWDDDDDEDEGEYDAYDESSVRTRPNPKGNRPRTKTRPEHADATIARVLGVDRGRYTVLLDEDRPDERQMTAARASELRRHLLDRLRDGELERGEELLAVMDDAYAALVEVDFPDAITHGLRRTLDALRAVLERTRGDVTTTVLQTRLRESIDRAAGA